MESLTLTDIAWAAGFLEGEGSFIASGSCITTTASQKQLEPLERLQHMFGGFLKLYTNKRGFACHRWTVNGSHAIAVSYTVFSFLSPRRREQVIKQVATWKARPGRNNRLKQRCPRGHEYTPDNTYRLKGNRRACRECYRTHYNQPRHLRVAGQGA